MERKMKLRTTEEWLKEGLSPDNLMRVFAHLEVQDRLHRLKELAASFNDALAALSWELTPEGFMYWQEIEFAYNYSVCTLDQNEKLIIEWGEKRNFYGEGGATPQMQFVKLIEECGELAGNLGRGRDVKDDIGDIFVVLVHIAKLSGTSVTECVRVAYKDIKDRKGAFVNGTFVKEADL